MPAMKTRTLMCPRCCKPGPATFMEHDERHEFGGVGFTAHITSYTCNACGEELADPAVPEMMTPIWDAYRAAAGTLAPADVKAIRERAGLSQAAFATLLGMSPATMNLIEKGSPIKVKEDNLLRLCALPGAVRMLLRIRGNRLRPRQRPKPPDRGSS